MDTFFARPTLVGPMAAQAFLILVVLLVTFGVRVYMVKTRRVRMSYFRTLQTPAGGDIPDVMARTSRSFVNQFEVPVLFFVGCLAVMQVGATDQTYQTLAWIFVASRALHAAIHIAYNNVMHRMLAYMVGVAMVACMWARLALAG